MKDRCSGGGLMLAGLIVTMVGLALALGVTLQIPRHWTPVLIGVVLFAIGAVRWAIAGRREGPRRGEP